jgi:hypothetical protein
MNVILEQYRNVESRILPYLRGSLTRGRLANMLAQFRNVVDEVVDGMLLDTQENVINRACAHIAPKDLGGTALTAHTVIESLAVSAFLNEYLVTLTSLPKLKVAFWNELEKDGVNFHLWSSIERAMHDRE